MAGLARYNETAGGLHTLDGLMLAELTKVTIATRATSTPVYTRRRRARRHVRRPLEVEVC